MVYKSRKNGRGAAMIMVICAMALVTVLCASLLLGASTVMASVQRDGDREQCRILAVTLSQQMETQLVQYHFSSASEEAEANGTLWAYCREKMTDGSWPYFNDEERGHTKRYAFRHFTFDTATAAALTEAELEDVTVVMYWESANDADLDGTPLVMQVTCTRRGESCTIVSEFTLGFEKETDPETGESYDRWIWSLNWRE